MLGFARAEDLLSRMRDCRYGSLFSRITGELSTGLAIQVQDDLHTGRHAQHFQSTIYTTVSFVFLVGMQRHAANRKRRPTANTYALGGLADRSACPLNLREQRDSDLELRRSGGRTFNTTPAGRYRIATHQVSSGELATDACSQQFCRLCVSLAGAVASVSQFDDTADRARLQVSSSVEVETGTLYQALLWYALCAPQCHMHGLLLTDRSFVVKEQVPAKSSSVDSLCFSLANFLGIFCRLLQGGVSAVERFGGSSEDASGGRLHSALKRLDRALDPVSTVQDRCSLLERLVAYVQAVCLQATPDSTDAAERMQTDQACNCLAKPSTQQVALSALHHLS